MTADLLTPSLPEQIAAAAELLNPDIPDQIACLEWTLTDMRRRFPAKVMCHRMKQKVAVQRIAEMEAAIKTLSSLIDCVQP